jgi:hypothetical protein
MKENEAPEKLYLSKNIYSTYIYIKSQTPMMILLLNIPELMPLLRERGNGLKSSQNSMMPMVSEFMGRKILRILKSI